jgi:glycosyltransferase involved in cell wall biosynthesis
MDGDKLELSVVIPTFNRLPILRETVRRIVRHTFPREKLELIIIDDCSSDGTAEFLAGLTLPISFRYSVNKENLGRATSRNFGIKQARGEYVLMIDDDIWASPSLMEEHLKQHRRNNEAVAVVGAIVVAAGIPNTAVNERLSAHHLWCYEEMIKHTQNLPYHFCKTANLSISKALAEKVGLFNELFSSYGGEDTEFGYRLFTKNINLIFAREAVGYHYHNETVESLIIKEMERGKTYFTYQQLHPEHELDTRTFFSPFYQKGSDIRTMLCNFAKMILFTSLSRLMNRLFIRSFNQRGILRSFLVKYLVPILQMQYYRLGIKRTMK